MKSKIVKALVAFLFVMLTACTVCFMSACSCGGNNNKVTVTFVTNGGNEIAPITLKKGEKLTLPTAEKEGRVFADWYYDESFTSVCPKKITAEKNETLYARYGAVLTFVADGGTEIEPRTYFEGEEIGILPVSYKNGFSFGGWYYDAKYNQTVGKKDNIEYALTVYAKFSEKAETIRKLTSVKNVSLSPVVEVKTDGIVLHNGNISDYISFVSSSGEKIDLICSPSKNGAFIVEPDKNLSEGMTYSAKTLSSLLKFVAVDGNDTENADEVTLTTHKEEKNVLEKKPSVHLTSSELARWEENVYVYMDAGLEKNVNRIVARTDKEINVGSIVTVGEKPTAQDTDYICKAISVKKERMQYVVGSDIKEDEFYVLDVVTPNVDDVYSDIDIYGEKQAQLEGVINLSAETIAENVEKNEGIVMLKNAVRNAVAQSPTITDYTNALSKEEKAAVVAAIAGFEFQKPKVKIDIKGTALAFEIELGGEIQVKNFKVGVSVTIKNKTQVDYRYTICKSKLVTLNPLLWFYTDIKVDLINDFSISLAATAEFADAKDDIHGIIDITDEVEYVMDIAKDGQNKFAEAITGSPLWDDDGLEYVDIFSIPLGQIPLPVPVVSLMLEFNVVGSLGARAGLYVEFSHHYVETTTLTNGASADGGNGKPVMYNEFKFLRNTTANEIELSIMLKGQVGFRCGLEAKLSLSVLKLNNVAAVYVSFRFGPYIELSGLVNFRYSYDAVNKVSETYLYGGMYLEVGLFVNAKIGAKFLVYDLNTDIFDKKIPLYGVGDRLIPLDFIEKQNSPDNPYVITSRYGGVRMNSVEMNYLDIATGEKVVDNALRTRYGALLWYEFEFVDAPDYQTRDYDKYVTINNGSPIISRNFPYKSLKYVIKVKLLPRHGVYASGIERIFYVEYRNPDGRDYAVMNNEFRNEYYAGGGSTHSEVLARLSYLEGEQVVPPDFSEDELPVRQGYYLDLNDLWEKYFPFLDDQIDESFDGTYPVVTYENATQIYKGYLIVNTCYYRLKWKQRVFKAEFSSPVYITSSEIARTERLLSADMLYVPSLRYFVVLTDQKIVAPDIAGKKYSEFVSTSGLTFFADYYEVDPNADAFKGFDIEAGFYPRIRVDTESNLYLENFDGIKNGAQFVATYTDENVFTETYVLETETVSRVKAEYKPFDYVGKTIRPLPPEQFAIGAEFTENENVYIIKGYRDINAENDESSRFYEVNSMPDVTKNRIWYVLYERKGFDELPVFYVNIVANGQKIGDFGIKQGEPINVALLKINFSDETVVSRLAGYPLMTLNETIKTYSVVWDETNIPAQMPEKDIAVNLTATYTFNEFTAEFIVSDPLQSFADGLYFDTNPDGNKVYTAKGKTWTFGSTDDAAFYSLPKLNDYFDADGKKYYAFYGWKNAGGEEYPYGIRIAFVKNEVYTPIFSEKTVLPTIAFVSVGDYGYEYYYRIIEGEYFGKTLKEVIQSAKIDPPSRGDVNGIYEYEFKDWGVDEKSYVVGTEKDSNGNVKNYIVFKAQFNETYKRHTATFEALGGYFSDGEKTLKKVGVYGEDISFVAAEDYSDEKGDFAFICWTTIPYSLDHKVDKEDLKIGTSDVTYYAYYSLSPATITLTFKGKVQTEESDGTGNVYFGGDKSKTELKVSDLYGRGYYLTASEFAVDSKSKTFVPDYLKWTVDGEELRSAFYNDGYMAYIPFDNNATVEIVFKPAAPKIVNIAFVSDGKCFEPDGTIIDGVICNGYMSGFRHVANYYEAYGSTMTAPNVDYYSANYYRFDRWEANLTDGNSVISVKAGDTITFTEDIVFYGVYVHDTAVKVELTFRADESFGSSEGDGDLVGLKIFDDGSVEIKDYGTAGENIAFDKIPSCKGKKFIGWKTGNGDEIITPSELKEKVYSVKTTYYAVYEPYAENYKVVLNAGDGKFADGKTEKEVDNVPFGRLTKDLEKPVPHASGLVFSHYENERGYPVTVVEKAEKLYARYAKPVSTFEELQNINLSPEQNYVLQNDIKLGGHVWDDGNLVSWTAIGANNPSGFSGTFNGNGYKISFSAKSGTKQNFGLFSKISGTVYNLSVVGYFSISGTTDATALGAFASEVAESGRIIDCVSFVRFTVAVKANQKLSVSGAIGVNNGLIDGLMTSASGEINIDSDKEFNVGSTVGTNNGTMKNVNQSGRGGSVYVTLVRSLNCNIGSFAGYNSGKIENCFSERAITINLSQGDNVYLKESVRLGGFVGKNDGTIENSTTLYGYLDYTVSNLTLLGEKGLYLSYISYLETPRYIVYAVGKDDQGPTYTTKCVIYLDKNAQKEDSDEYEEYTLSEFATAHPAEAKKIESLRKCIVFNNFVAVNNGKIANTTNIEKLGTGNGVELVSSCGFDELKWNYLLRLHETVYQP